MIYNIEIPHNWNIRCYIDPNKQCSYVDFVSYHPGSFYGITDFAQKDELAALEKYFIGRDLKDIHGEVASLTNDEWWKTHKSFDRWKLAELIRRATEED